MLIITVYRSVVPKSTECYWDVNLILCLYISDHNDNYCLSYIYVKNISDALETIQDDVDRVENVGASRAEAGFLKEFFDEPSLGALLEVRIFIQTLIVTLVVIVSS